MLSTRAAHLCAALIVATGVGLSLARAWFVPIFQCPDEYNHYDYALTLASAGRRIRHDERFVDAETHPAVRYLLERTNGRSVRFDPLARVPDGYGRPDFFAALDRDAPHIEPGRFGAAAIAPAPYLSAVYPLGYYALAASVATAVQRLSGDSAVATFFAVRGLSSVLFATALACSWLLLRRMHVGAPLALGLLAATAWFPLAAEVAGCVQPDNLSFALVSASLLLALDALARPKLPRLLALGLVLSALAATKQHYFAAVFAATAAPLGVRALAAPNRRRSLAALALVSALAFTAFVLTSPDRSATTGLCASSGASLTQAVRSEPGEALERAVRGTVTQAGAAFAGGHAMQTFWLAYGPYGSQWIEIGTLRLSILVYGAIAGVSVAVTALFALRLLSTAIRLRELARRRSLASALRVAAGGVPVNAYLIFVVLLLVFSAYEGAVAGDVALQGRYWLPFLPVVWYVAIVLAPRSLPHALQLPTRRGLLGALLSFCVLATIFAFPSVHRRYHEAAAANPARETSVVLTATSPRISGYAIDLRSAAPAQRVVVAFDDGRTVAATPTGTPGVACAETESSLARSGFAAGIPPEELRREDGSFTIRLQMPWSAQLVTSTAGVRLHARHHAP